MPTSFKQMVNLYLKAIKAKALGGDKQNELIKQIRNEFAELRKNLLHKLNEKYPADETKINDLLDQFYAILEDYYRNEFSKSYESRKDAPDTISVNDILLIVETLEEYSPTTNLEYIFDWIRQALLAPDANIDFMQTQLKHITHGSGIYLKMPLSKSDIDFFTSFCKVLESECKKLQLKNNDSDLVRLERVQALLKDWPSNQSELVKQANSNDATLPLFVIKRLRFENVLKNIKDLHVASSKKIKPDYFWQKSPVDSIISSNDTAEEKIKKLVKLCYSEKDKIVDEQKIALLNSMLKEANVVFSSEEIINLGKNIKPDSNKIELK